MRWTILLISIMFLTLSFATVVNSSDIVSENDFMSKGVEHNAEIDSHVSTLRNTDYSNSFEDVGSTNRSSFEAETFTYKGKSTVFASPDSATDTITDFLNDVNSSLNVAIYLFNHPMIAKRIANLSQNGVNVRILIEGSPVLGMSKGSLSCLDLIDEKGGNVQIMDERDTYNYYHPKYMIKDNTSVMFTSENLVSPGFPEDETQGNRGWGIILNSKELASYYLEVYEHDWKLGTSFQNTGSNIVESDWEPGLYHPNFKRTEINGTFKVTTVLSPDTSMSEKTILDMIRSAENTIYVQQYYIRHWEDEENPYIEALKDAAEREVKVKIMLDSTWYHLGENGNDRMVHEINEFASQNDLSMEARLLSSYKNLLKSHNKGMVVDGNQTLISSINWNANSVLFNREAGVIVKNDRVGEYYSSMFLEDWVDTIEPIADAGRERTVTAGEEFILSGENSWDDHDIVSYKWDIDDNGIYDTRGEEIKLVFEDEGMYKVELLVEDVGGNTDTDIVTIEVIKESDGFLSEILNWFILISPTIAILLLLLKSTIFSKS